MNTATIIALAVAVLALVGVAVLAVLLISERRRHTSLLVAQRTEIDELRAERLVPDTAPLREAPAVAEFLITDIGTEAGAEPRVDDRIVLTATLGEPLVRAAAFGHGLRRALSPRSLNRIRYEIRREVRRSRRQRRRDMRRAWSGAGRTQYDEGVA